MEGRVRRPFSGLATTAPLESLSSLVVSVRLLGECERKSRRSWV